MISGFFYAGRNPTICKLSAGIHLNCSYTCSRIKIIGTYAATVAGGGTGTGTGAGTGGEHKLCGSAYCPPERFKQEGAPADMSTVRSRCRIRLSIPARWRPPWMSIPPLACQFVKRDTMHERCATFGDPHQVLSPPHIWRIVRRPGVTLGGLLLEHLAGSAGRRCRLRMPPRRAAIEAARLCRAGAACAVDRR